VIVLTVAALLASNPPQLPGFLNTVGSYLGHYGIWAILVLVMIEDFGIPVPGETILIAGAIYAGAGRMNIVTVGIVGFIAAVVGDNIGFAIGHFGGRALALRWGRYIFLTEERLDRAEHFFENHGGKVITIARFIEGLRQANGIIAGITGMRWIRFLAFNALGAALWVGTWVSLGYLAGNHITTIYHYITQYSYYALIAVGVLVVGYIAWHIRRRHRRRAATASGTSDGDNAGEARDSTETHASGSADVIAESEGTGEVTGVAADGHPVDRNGQLPGERVPGRTAIHEPDVTDPDVT
jgi:membrane protein DedA with SNARE-associated domain